MLPGTDGVELMRNTFETDNTPVIFVSAYGQDRLVAKALEAGASDYVVKPLLSDRTRGPDQGGAAQAGGA